MKAIIAGRGFESGKIQGVVGVVSRPGEKRRTIASFRGSVQELGRVMLCSAGLSGEKDFRSRIASILQGRFACNPDGLRADQRELICESLDWIGVESGLWKDVVRLCRGLASLDVSEEFEAGLRLKASIVFKNFLDDREGAFAELLEIHKIDPFSTKNLELVCAKIGALETDYPSKGYWTRLAGSYGELLPETDDPQRQVAVLVLMAWILSKEEGQERRVLGCLRAAHSLLPDNQAIVEKIETAKRALWKNERSRHTESGMAMVNTVEMQQVSVELRDALEQSMTDSFSKAPLCPN